MCVTADRTHRGLFIDVDFYCERAAIHGNEHRIHGLSARCSMLQEIQILYTVVTNLR